jgi:hypothetical protein
MRKSILFESQPAPCQPSRMSRPLFVHTPLVVLAASTVLFAIQISAQTPAAQIPAKPPASAAAKPSATKAHKQVHRRKNPAKNKSLAAKAPVTPVPVVVTPPPPEPPHWPANERPADASVIWDSRGLLISAQNSSLKQILDDIAAATGAKVEGLGADQRIFGSYGPGKAHEVLTQLLDGTGYNVLLIGDQGAGTPRQIVLTSRNGSSNTQAAANPASPPPNPAADEEPDPNEEPADNAGARRLGGRRGNPNNPDQGEPQR